MLRRYIHVLSALSFALCLCDPTFGQAKHDAETQQAPVACPYATAHALPLDAKETVTAQADDHTEYRAEFNGIKNDRVPACLYVPKRRQDAPPAAFPVVLLQYGSGGHKQSNYIVAIAKRFVARQYIVLTIDTPSTGERKKPDAKWSALWDLVSSDQVMQSCGDYSRAIDYLSTRADVDNQRLGYVGVSRGAITGVIFVAYDPRVKAMVSIVGGGNFLGMYSNDLAERIAVEGSRSSDPVYHVARIAPRPLLFINATKDQIILRSWAESLHNAAGVGSSVTWVEADHVLNGVDRTAVCDSAIDFMDAHLAGKPK
jgi:dienelactone hydrolase